MGSLDHRRDYHMQYLNYCEGFQSPRARMDNVAPRARHGKIGAGSCVTGLGVQFAHVFLTGNVTIIVLLLQGVRRAQIPSGYLNRCDGTPFYWQ